MEGGRGGGEEEVGEGDGRRGGGRGRGTAVEGEREEKGDTRVHEEGKESRGRGERQETDRKGRRSSQEFTQPTLMAEMVVVETIIMAVACSYCYELLIMNND